MRLEHVLMSHSTFGVLFSPHQKLTEAYQTRTSFPYILTSARGFVKDRYNLSPPKSTPGPRHSDSVYETGPTPVSTEMALIRTQNC
ncbi:hypothetical protein PILCRDRAFT_697635 [Piloderma croceum F 1598]|uniref:Uncharacterized protein n=1 Tax=Piloderma croceum (strain F 1598) TaxID=765440 RepID=A0A0C3F3Q8_PILCF|nr:hypothetical protein PILCRDRAFT_697635 [Piloderma croceum F 1598]